MSQGQLKRHGGSETEVLYFAQECGHLQWVKVLEVETGMDSVNCEKCDDYGVRRTWLKVMS